MGFLSADGVNPTDRRIIGLAVPALGSLAVEPLYVLVDTAIIGRLGTAQLGGLAVAATVLALVVAGCNFLTYGTTERVARRLGAGRPSAAADVAVQTMWLSALVGLVVAPLVALAAPFVARWLGASGDVFEFGVTYLRIGAIGLPFVLVVDGRAWACSAALPTTGHRWSSCSSSNLVNAVLEVLFVFGFDWGVPGSAWSTVIAQVGAGVAFLLMVRRHFQVATHRRPSWHGMAPLLSAGRHLLLRVGSMLAVTTGATAIAARVDEPTLAAHQIAASMFIFLALVLDALAIPAQTLVADELGQGSVASAADLSNRCVRLSIIAGAAFAIALAALAPVLPDAFTADAAVVERATTALWWLAAMLVPAAIAFAYDGVLIGAADYRFLGYAALAYLVSMLPIGAVLMVTDAGIGAIWAAVGVWMVLRALGNHLRARHVLRPPIAVRVVV